MFELPKSCRRLVVAFAFAFILPLAGMNAAPVLAHSPQQETPAAEATVTVVTAINVRSGPGTSYSILAVARPGASFGVTGKNAAGSWWRIDYNGRAGWLFAALVEAENVDAVPVVEASQSAVGSGSSVATGSTAGPSSAVTAAQPPAVNFNPQAVQFKLETVFTGLGQPTLVTNAGDGSGRLFVLERPGYIKVFPAPGSEGSSGKLFLDIEDRVDASGPEQGLLGLAFAPDYETSGLFYVNYTDNQGDTVVARYRVSDDPDAADKGSEQQLLWVDQPAPNHNGGMLAFGRDGRLWVGMGDGGGANDTFGNGQNPNTPLGKIVRLDVSGGAPNSFWATGLRNPWRFSFDRQTGDLWIADVGQSLFEEINYIPAAQVQAGGFNFGWPIMEGMHCRGSQNCANGGPQLPLYEYGHEGNGCSVTGGYVYRGQAYPALRGVYLYADFCSGNIWALWRGSDGVLHNEKVLPNAAAVSSFGEDEAGELYVTDFGGAVHRVTVTEK